MFLMFLLGIIIVDGDKDMISTPPPFFFKHKKVQSWCFEFLEYGGVRHGQCANELWDRQVSLYAKWTLGGIFHFDPKVIGEENCMLQES